MYYPIVLPFLLQYLTITEQLVNSLFVTDKSILMIPSTFINVWS
jgi:hypothetical protein